MRGLLALLAALSCAAPAGRAAAAGGALSSNAIKGPPPGGAAEASAAPAVPFDGSNKPPPAATRQVGAGIHRGLRGETHVGYWGGHTSGMGWGTHRGWGRNTTGLTGVRVGDGDGETHREWGFCGPADPPSPLCSPLQPFPCAEDEDCGPEEFCGGAARGGGAPLCLSCRRRRKRCLRDAMCCPGTTCSNGEGRRGLGESGAGVTP